MTRTRLTAADHNDYSFDFDPETCDLNASTKFYADIDLDGIDDKIVVREDSYVDVPNSSNLEALLPFTRYSTITITVYESADKYKAHATQARFKDTFEMSLDTFNNSPDGSCPSNTFRGLYLSTQKGMPYLEFAAANYTLTTFRGEDYVGMIRERSATMT